MLREKFHDYAALYEKEGIEGIRIRTTIQKIPDARKFFLRVESKDGKTLFLYAPEDAHEEWPSIKDIDLLLQKQSKDKTWVSIAGSGFGDEIEILSRQMPSGEYLQIGKDMEDREAVLQSYAKAFFLGWLPVFAFTIFLGFFFSNRLLSPLRWLIHTVKSIRSGNESARVPVLGNRNELDQLASLLNEMLNQNEKLINGMRETLDHVAHDLRTPLMRLQLSTESALLPGASADLAKDALADCKETSDTILRMLNAIMAISEAETGTLPLSRKEVSQAKLLKDVIELYSFVAEEKNIKLVANDQSYSPSINADETRLMQALANLVDNAIKFSPEGSVVEITSRSETKVIIFEVKDQGPGISQEDLPRIWDRLYRGDRSRSTRGLGLGLSLVKAIAYAHGGTAKVSPNPEVGCTFSLSIPSKANITQM